MLTEELDEPERLVKLSRIDPVCLFHVTSPALRNHARSTFRSAPARRPRRGGRGGRWSERLRSVVGARAGHLDRLRPMPDIDALRLRLLWLGQPDPQYPLLVCGF